MELPELKCDVCGQPTKLVCASSLGAISFAYCKDCLKVHAEPYGMVLYTVAEIGLDDCAEWVKPIIEGTLMRVGKTHNEFMKDLEEEKIKISQMY